MNNQAPKTSGTAAQKKDPRTRVLFVIESLSGGGAEKVLATLTKQINKERFHTTVCTIVDTGVHTEEVKAHVDRYASVLGNPDQMGPIRKLWYRVLYKLIYHILPMRWVYNLFVPHHADVEVAFIEGYVTKLLSASTNKQAKKLAWVHTDLEKNHWTHYLYNNLQEESSVYRKYHDVICVSKSVKKSYERLFANPSNSLICYNPIDADDIVRKSREDSTLPKKNDQIIRFITCGRLIHQKGYDRLIHAINQSVIDKRKIELYIFGTGVEHQQLSDIVKKNQLEEIVYLEGFNNNVYRDLKTADLFICSSRAEGFSLVIVESLILGVPVLSTYCSGPNELLEEGEYGYLCDNSTSGLAQSIKKLCTEPKLLMHYRHMATIRGQQLKTMLSISEIEHILKP